MRLRIQILMSVGFWLNSCTLSLSTNDRRLSNSNGTVLFNSAPFTGATQTYHADGRAWVSVAYKDGLKHGKHEAWYSNGTKDHEIVFAAGKKQGVHRGWHDNGAIRYQREFSNDLPVGEAFAWHDNGTLAEYIRYEKQGDQIVHAVQKLWRADGKIFSNKITRADGKIAGLPGDKLCFKAQK